MREAIDSALAQIYKNIEVLVVNDGSNDNGKTRKIALSYGNKIRYFEKEKNGGVSTALNLGIKNMTGDYFSWLSHDDLYFPAKIETEINYLINHNLVNKKVILFADYYLIDKNSRIIAKCINDHKMLIEKPEYALLRGAVNDITLLIPKKAFKEHGLFDENLQCTQDYMLWHKMFKTYKPVHIPEILVSTRDHNTQASKTNPKFVTENNDLWIMMIEDLAKFDKERLEGSEYFYYFNMWNFFKTTLTPYTYKEAEQHCLKIIEKIRADRIKKINLKNILVTVIIPFYNRPNETIRAIKSVLLQTHKNYEIILINDKSTEDISSIEDFIKNNKRISLINLKNNLGPAGARNEGLKYSKGDYIAFLDSDDEFLPEKLEIQLTEMLISDSVISHTSFILKMNTEEPLINSDMDSRGVKRELKHIIKSNYFYEHKIVIRMNNEEIVVNSGTDNGDVKRKFMYNCPVATPTVMLKRKYIVENNYFYDPKIRKAEDICYYLTILKKSSILGIEKPLSIVNASINSSSYDPKKNLEGVTSILRFLINDEYYSNYDLEISKVAEYYALVVKRKYMLKQSYYQRFKKSIKNDGFIGASKKIIKRIYALWE
ncbi:MAG: glycosyltransferase [Methanobrevibacter sp.]|nr:glycosyltransferase [Methanobrevibacter sp.]